MNDKEFEIKMVKVSKIKETDNNAKIHDELQIAQIINSIELFGFNDPIALDENNEIIEGNGRLEAAKKLGLDKVPCFYINGLTDQQKTAYALVHNKLTMNSPFDYETLKEELADIKEIDMTEFSFNLDNQLYFDEEAQQDNSKFTEKINAIVNTEKQAEKLRSYLKENKIKFRES